MSTLAALPRRAVLKLAAAFALVPAAPRRSWARPAAPVQLVFGVTPSDDA